MRFLCDKADKTYKQDQGNDYEYSQRQEDQTQYREDDDIEIGHYQNEQIYQYQHSDDLKDDLDHIPHISIPLNQLSLRRLY